MARHAARKGALALPPLPDDDAGLVAPTRAPLVLGSAANPARAPLKEKLGEREPAGIRAGFVALAPVGAALFLGLLALHLVAAEGDFVMAGRVLAAAAGLLMFAGGLLRFGLISHFLTGMAFTGLGLFSLAAFSMDPSVLPAVGFIASVLAVDYVWSVRKRLRTGEMRSFDRLLRPFQHATPLRGSAPQNALIELNNQIAAAGSVRAVIPEDVLLLESIHRVRIPADLPGETRILYARYLRHFLEDDFLDDGEKEEIAALERLLRLPPAVRASVRKAIAAWLYKTRAREAMHDGRLEDHERALLDRIAADLELPARDAERIFRTHAKALARAAARDDRADGVLADADVAEAKDMAAHPAIPIGDGIGRATPERHRQG